MSGSSDDFFSNFNDASGQSPATASSLLRSRTAAAGASSASSSARAGRQAGGAKGPPPPPPPPRGAQTTEHKPLLAPQQQQASARPSRPSAPRSGGRPAAATAPRPASSASYYQSQPVALKATATPSYLLSTQSSSSAAGTQAPPPHAFAAARASNPSYYAAADPSPSAAPEAAAAEGDDDWYSGPSAQAPSPSAMASAQPPYYTPTVQPQPSYPYAQQQSHQQPTTMGAAPAPWIPDRTDPLQWEGTMSGGSGNVTAAAPGAPSIFQPSLMRPTAVESDSTGGLSQGAGGYDEYDFSNEPPLLEELGINLEHIWLKTKAVVLPFRRFSKTNTALLEPDLIVKDADLAGPLALALALGGQLLLMGKVHFGYIYGFGLFGCLSLTLVLNLMSPAAAVSVWTVTSILGYSLLPVNVLAALRLLFFFAPPALTKAFGVLAVLWSTTASTRLLEVGCGMAHQRYLIAYPIALVYSAFVLITIF